MARLLPLRTGTPVPARPSQPRAFQAPVPAAPPAPRRPARGCRGGCLQAAAATAASSLYGLNAARPPARCSVAHLSRQRPDPAAALAGTGPARGRRGSSVSRRARRRVDSPHPMAAACQPRAANTGPAASARDHEETRARCCSQRASRGVNQYSRKRGETHVMRSALLQRRGRVPSLPEKRGYSLRLSAGGVPSRRIRRKRSSKVWGNNAPNHLREHSDEGVLGRRDRAPLQLYGLAPAQCRIPA